MAEGTVQTIQTSAAPEVVFAVASDVAAYPHWASGVREAEVLEMDEDQRPLRARFVIDGIIREITYTLRYSYDDGEMSWVAEPGDDIEEMEGKYEFYQLDDGGTEIVYALKVQPAFSVPGFLRRQAERQIVGTALRGLKAQAEAAAAG